MSYEGYTEYLCDSGHYFARDCNDSRPERCVCGEMIAWRHSVDQTNGYDEGNPGTCDAPKRLIGGDDIPRTDHKGNKYFALRERYAPNSREWQRCRGKDRKPRHAEALARD